MGGLIQIYYVVLAPSCKRDKSVLCKKKPKKKKNPAATLNPENLHL